MGLPFLEPKKIVSVIGSMKKGKSMDVASETQPPGQEVDPGLKAAAEDLLQAINDKSVIGIATALKAAMDMSDSDDSEPSDEDMI